MFHINIVSTTDYYSRHLKGKYFIEYKIDRETEYSLYDWDLSIASILKLSLEEYRTILSRYGSFVDDDSYFHSREDAQHAIEELELYRIMAQLS